MKGELDCGVYTYRGPVYMGKKNADEAFRG